MKRFFGVLKIEATTEHTPSSFCYCHSSSWSREILSKGYKKNVQPADLYAHVPSLDSREVSHSLLEHWERELKRPQPSVMHMIFKAYGKSLVPICILYSLVEILLQ